MSSLLLTIQFHDDRYHGLHEDKRPEWPPSPARLFQALVAGAARGKTLDPEDCAALSWLETLPPPVIAAPPARRGRPYDTFVPNNDLDAKGGDPARVAEIRAGKRIQPMLLSERVCLLYLFRYEQNGALADHVVSIAGQLYQLGRGVDMAWAQGAIVGYDEAERRLREWRGAIHLPHKGNSGTFMDCPTRGTLESLIERFRETAVRFRSSGNVVTFAQPPRVRFQRVAYDSKPTRLLYDLRDTGNPSPLHPWSQSGAAQLVEAVRDGAAARLAGALPAEKQAIERVFIGRGATEADKTQRIRIIPLPSIGHPHADYGIRRLLVEIPPDVPLATGDIGWAFSGLAIDQVVLAPAADQAMLTHYGVGGDAFHRWRTVTPAVLQVPRVHGRRSGIERNMNQARVADAVKQGLRHAGVRARTESILVQREPFESNGALAKAFAAGTRFDPQKLWHVEIGFAESVRAPLLLGDGRYLGLGLMAPVREASPIHYFSVTAPIRTGEETLIARALRRAIMARVRDTLRLGHGKGLPLFFCGHEANGGPARDSSHGHIHVAALPYDPGILLVVAPHRIAHRPASLQEKAHLTDLDAALQGLTRLVVGRNRVLDVATLSPALAEDPLIGPAQVWESATPYVPTRHAGRGKYLDIALPIDVWAECRRVGLPRPDVEVVDSHCGPKGGNPTAHLRLRFAVAVSGPIMIGRLSHQGGGIFVAPSNP